jgi:hypothetical protein
MQGLEAFLKGEYNIKVYLRETGCENMNWTEFAQDCSVSKKAGYEAAKLMVFV